MNKVNNTRDVAVIIVQNSTGKFLVHQRSASKKIFPGLYGLGAGGRMEAGEKPEETAKRELKEELGIIATPKFLFSFPFSYADFSRASHIARIFHVVHEGPFADCSEFKLAGWKSSHEVDEIAASGRMCPDTRLAWELFKRGK